MQISKTFEQNVLTFVNTAFNIVYIINEYMDISFDKM